MPRRCSICDHPQRVDIDAALVANVSSYRSVAAKFQDVAHASLIRHAGNCIPEALAQAADAASLANAEQIYETVTALLTEARLIGTMSKANGDLRTALMSVGQILKICELQAKLIGELQTQNIVNVQVNIATLPPEQYDAETLQAAFSIFDDRPHLLEAMRTRYFK